MLTTWSAPERRRNYSKKPRWQRGHSGFPGISRAFCLLLAAEELAVNIHDHYSMIKVKQVTTSPQGAKQRIGNECCTLLFGLLKFCRDWQDAMSGGAMLGAAQSLQLVNEGDKGSRNQHLACGQLTGLSLLRTLQVMLLNTGSLKAWLRCLNIDVCCNCSIWDIHGTWRIWHRICRTLIMEREIIRH